MRYPALGIVIVVQHVLALGVLTSATVAMLRTPGAETKVWIGLGAGIAIVALLGFAELLRVLMDIEANTRRMADAPDAAAPTPAEARSPAA